MNQRTRKNYELVIFDWDGTVADSTQVIVESLQMAARDLGLQAPPVEKCRWIIGLTMDAALYELLPDVKPEQIEPLKQQYTKRFFEMHDKVFLFDGMRALLRDLNAAGKILAVATGKTRKGLDMAMERIKLEDYFRLSRTADMTASKPDPLMLEEILIETGIPVEKAVMVGDTSHDTGMAKAIGMDCIAVTYGAHERRSLEAENPTYIVDSVEELRAILLPPYCPSED